MGLEVGFQVRSEGVGGEGVESWEMAEVLSAPQEMQVSWLEVEGLFDTEEKMRKRANEVLCWGR